jgi:hypothetical protein
VVFRFLSTLAGTEPEAWKLPFSASKLVVFAPISLLFWLVFGFFTYSTLPDYDFGKSRLYTFRVDVRFAANSVSAKDLYMLFLTFCSDSNAGMGQF